MADGKVVISTALDNSGIEKDAGKLKSSAASAAKSIKGTLGGLTKVVAGVTASIVTAFGATAVAITKQAVDAYADYEQLIGGVETLFKDAADKVAGYAEDAFYTVGISANEYMETVTSFSASLISSLAGDTVKAADVANMALTDMADNANKMGTPLESIKTAYQGFAKQNYTMLDNLKLGYGGTKTEMERLLKDAQKLTGVKYNINNLADVYNAIHAIQEKLGIAGTTAKEAEKTITGSANMTKAAWKNVLAAIAGGGDLDKAINNLVYSVSKYFDNLAPVVERSLAGIGGMIERVAPQLVETVAAALIKAIPSLLNAVYQMIIGLTNGIYQGIVALFSGSTNEIEVQLNTTNDLAGNYSNAADSAYDLAHATEEAGKAAKKSLAPFDEIAKLSGKESNESTGGSTIAGAMSSAVTAPDSSRIEAEQSASPIVAVLGKVKKEMGGLLTPLKTINFSNLIKSLKSLSSALKPYAKLSLSAFRFLITNILTPIAKWSVRDLLPSFLNALSAALKALDAIINAAKPAIDWVWNSIIVPMGEFAGQVFVDFLNSLTVAFSGFSSWAMENKDILSQLFQIVLGFFAGIWVYNTTKNLISFLSTLGASFKKFCAIMLDGGLKTAFMAASIGILAAGIIALAANWGKMSPAERVITILSALAAAATAAAIAIGIFHTAWSVGVAAAAIAGGLALLGLSFAFSDTGNTGDAAQEAANSFYSSYDWNRTLSIPALAKGAVLPPNKPFMAIVGDQKHGTNIEAPLATIQEAVAIVMEDMVASNIAGHEATVAVLREILEAVLGIHIGDDVIGQAVARYNAKMAIIRGGA